MRQLQVDVCNPSGTRRERPFDPCTGEGPTPGLGSCIARAMHSGRFRVRSSAAARLTRVRASSATVETRAYEGMILLPLSLAAAGPAIGFLIVTLGVVLLIIAVLFLLHLNRGPK